jgi:hypothetical protein
LFCFKRCLFAWSLADLSCLLQSDVLVPALDGSDLIASSKMGTGEGSLGYTFILFLQLHVTQQHNYLIANYVYLFILVGQVISLEIWFLHPLESWLN